jgi:hypothetical protein
MSSPAPGPVFTEAQLRPAFEALDTIFLNDELPQPEFWPQGGVAESELVKLLRTRDVTLAVAREVITQLIDQSVFETAPGSYIETAYDSPVWRVLLINRGRWFAYRNRRPAAVLGPTDCASEAGGTPDQPDIGQLIERVALAAGDENTVEVLAIAHRQDWSAERKIEEILRLDPRFAGKNSRQWATLLGVTPQAVRQTGIWTELQRRKKSKD